MYYILILLWIGLCAFISKYLIVKRTELVCGIEVERYSKVFVCIMVIPLILLAGFRASTIGDTGAYYTSYKSIPHGFSEFSSYLSSQTKDIGFTILSYLIKTFFGDSVTFYLLIIAFIQGLIVTLFFRKYSISFILSIFLFVASTDYIGWMFNGIRQFLAVTIVLLATPFFFFF